MRNAADRTRPASHLALIREWLVKQKETHIRPSDEAADVRVGWWIGVDMFEVHVGVQPLDLFDDIDAGVHNELVHVARRFAVAEAGHAIAAAFGGPEGELEERPVCRGDNDEVVGHVVLVALGRGPSLRSINRVCGVVQISSTCPKFSRYDIFFGLLQCIRLPVTALL